MYIYIYMCMYSLWSSIPILRIILIMDIKFPIHELMTITQYGKAMFNFDHVTYHNTVIHVQNLQPERRPMVTYPYNPLIWTWKFINKSRQIIFGVQVSTSMSLVQRKLYVFHSVNRQPWFYPLVNLQKTDGKITMFNG